MRARAPDEIHSRLREYSASSRKESINALVCRLLKQEMDPKAAVQSREAILTEISHRLKEPSGALCDVRFLVNRLCGDIAVEKGIATPLEAAPG